MAIIIFSSIFIYIFETFLFWYYCQTAFGSKYKRGLNFAVIFAAMAICCAVNIIFTKYGNYVTIINSILNIVIFIALIYFLYGQKPLNSIIHASIYYVLIAASEYLLIPLVSLLFGNTFTSLYEKPTFYLLMSVISKVLHLIITVIVLKIYLSFFTKGEERAQSREKTKGLMLVLLIPVSGLIMFTSAELIFSRYALGMKEVVALTVSAVLLMLSTFAAFYLHSNTVKQAQKISRFTIEQKQREFDEQYNALLKKSNEEMQVLSHDFKNHLIQITDADNMEEVKAYVNKLYPTIQQFHSINVSENKTLNTIISKYNSLCAVKGIEFKYDISASLAFLERNDLTAILGNLLDNAVESAEQCSEKWIVVSIYAKNEKTTVLSVKNVCDIPPKAIKGELISTKADSAPHGLGLKSVKDTVDKYHGFYEWEYEKEKNCFTSLISFYGG